MEIIKGLKNHGGGQWYFSPLDLSCVKMVIKGTWLFTVLPDPALLRESLSELLDYYPHIAGRVRNRRYVEMNNEGVGFSVADRCDTTIDDVLHDPYAVDRYSLGIDLKKMLNGDAPLMVATLTNLKNGGVLSVHCAHACMDGSAFYTMVRNWGLLTRGAAVVTPVVEQSLYPKTDRILSREDVAARVSAMGWKKVSFTLLLSHLYQSITGVNKHRTEAIHIPQAVIDSLRQRISGQGGKIYGNHAILSAIAAKMCFSLAGTKMSEGCAVLSVVDLRGRLKNLPPEFAGNAVTNILSSEFTPDSPLQAIADAVDSSLHKMLDVPEKLEEFILLNKYAMEYKLPFVPFDVRGMISKRPTTVYLNNFSRFPMYGLDFGTGGPLRILPHNLPDIVKVFPTPDGDGVVLYLMGYPAKYYNRLGTRKAEWMNMLFKKLSCV